MENYSLPARKLCTLQADWLANARARMLRKAEIARRKSLLDLGCGFGIITGELRRRSAGRTIALDRNLDALQESSPPAVCADARQLPFPDGSFDLVFSQNLLLWTSDNTTIVVEQAARVLSCGGVWVLFEPDYGGMMEEPPELAVRDLWIAGLLRAGAEPLIGRKLPALLSDSGFRVSVELLPQLLSPSADRFEFLAELPLNPSETVRLQGIRELSQQLETSRQLSHLPYYLILAERL